MSNSIEITKQSLIDEIRRRENEKIIENTNAELIIKLINSAGSINEAITIAQLGTTYKKTGFHYDPRLEKMSNEIKYLKKNEELSFEGKENKLKHKLIIGDNYDALLNLLIEYRNKIDVIYIDPPYAKDSMGEFADTNYDNTLTRDNLLSMLYPRLILARELLNKDNGVIFCSIDDRNQAYVKCLFDDIFGEKYFLLNVPRITKKGGKSTGTIAKNCDYVLGYTVASEIVFSQEEKDIEKYKYEDEYVEERGKYALSQTLDYNSLQYSAGMDYEVEIDGRKFYPGGSKDKMEERLAGNHGTTDWVWRWSKSAVEWGKENDMFVIKNNRIYTKSYLYCRKKNGKNELEKIDPTKAFTTLSYIENQYSNDNGKKELDTIFDDGSTLFKNPKPTALISTLIKMACQKEDAIVLDFFAGSGTTGQAVLELNKDGGTRQFILCTNNEITDVNPNGIAYDVTSKRLKRVMTGSCYNGSKEFKLARNNFEPYDNSLEVTEICKVANYESTEGKTPFEVIDETLYDMPKFEKIEDKIDWVCNNFEITQNCIENDEELKNRIGGN